MPDPGVEQLRRVAAGLKAAGNEGQGLRRELMAKLTEAAKPIARTVTDPEHLKPYMPDRYALVLSADLRVNAQRILSGDPRISIRAVAKAKKRKVVNLDRGFINHPIYAQGLRSTWNWSNYQTGGMRPGFFTDACKEATPEIRQKVLDALSETAARIANGH